MADAVVRQLHFSPADTPPHLRPSPNGDLYQVQQRLDIRLQGAGGRPSSAASAGSAGSAGGSLPNGASSSGGRQSAGGGGSSRGFSFRVPSDDEDDIYADVDMFLPTTPFGGFLSSHPDGHVAAAAQQQQQQQQQEAALQEQQLQLQLQQMRLQQQVAGPGVSTQASPVEAVLWAHTQQLQATALRDADSRKQVLHAQLQAVEQDLAAQLHAVEQDVAVKLAQAAAADEQSRQQCSAERQQKLQEVLQQQAALQRAHASALQEVRKQQEAAAAEARRKAEEAAAAAEARAREQQAQQKQAAAEAAAAKAAEEAKAQAAAAAAAEADTAAAAAGNNQQQQQQPAPAPAAAAASAAAAAAGAGSTVVATPGALQYEAQLKARWEEAEAKAAELTSNPALKQARRSVEKKITMWVGQISGTQMQVQAKAQQLVELLNNCSEAERCLACITLANRVMSQAEVQVLRLGSFAFPLAYVCVAVGAAVPQFMELLLARMQQACPLLVPKHTKYRPGTDKGAYLKALGYKPVDDPKTGEKRLETHDEYVARMAAIMLLYASVVQTEAAGNPAGVAHGWTWLARCLNSLPPTRPSAAALMAFLAHAGYRMSAVYGRQFHKLLQHMMVHFLPALEAKAVKNADLRAVGTRLQTYVTTQAYRREPEGRTLKKRDESEYTRA